MSKIGIIGDIHFGVKTDTQSFLRYQLNYFEKEVFPELIKQKISHVIQMGDFFNNRKSLNVNTYHWVKKRFLDPLKKMNIKMFVIIGNHDAYYTQSNDITSLTVLNEYHNIEVIIKPTLKEIDGFKFSMVPWISNENDKQSLYKFIENNPHNIIFGHFEFNNFEVIPGHIHQGGLEKDVFKNFDAVYSGHFHQKQKQDNIFYTGTPYELTWSDYKTEKGWYTIDTKTKELVFYKNNNNVHHKIYYDEDFFDDSRKELKNIRGKIIKLYAIKKTDEAKFSNFIFELEQNSPESFVIIDSIERNEDIMVTDEGKDLFDIIKDYLNDTDEKDVKIEKILSKLYQEVLTE